MSEGRMTAEQTPDIEAVLREAIVSGLRKCRHEEAPIPLAREGNEYHVSFMVLREVAPVLAAERVKAEQRALREAAQIVADCATQELGLGAAERAILRKAAAAAPMEKVEHFLTASVREARAADLREAADFIAATSGIGKSGNDFGRGWYGALEYAIGELRDRADRVAVDAPEGEPEHVRECYAGPVCAWRTSTCRPRACAERCGFAPNPEGGEGRAEEKNRALSRAWRKSW